MAQLEGKVIPVAIEDEVRTSYLTYAMSVIVSRALPDIRDGLKPVHRRILYTMIDMGYRSDRPFKKSGRIVGDVLGRYHPHGDQSIYDALVRLAQLFSMRYPVVQGQGNFGSVDGDPPAAMRYTEARLSRIAEEILRDIGKNTVDFGPNYDDSLTEPLVLPARVPYLLVNGASGIAVGMATNMPPHNLTETASAIAAWIDNPDISNAELMEHLPGPDFPTGGIIYGTRGIREAYETGRGKITVRARFSIEQHKSGRDVIIVNELPYQVNKAVLIARIAELATEKRIDGIADLRDESDRNGMRIVIELRKGVTLKVVLNRLFAMTQLQANFNVNALALEGGRPRVVTLTDQISAFVRHRREVVIRRARFDLARAEERQHILLGLVRALDALDEVIALIRRSATVEAAREGLIALLDLSERQAQAILDMRLQRLTSLETTKLREELAAVETEIAELKALLASDQRILDLVREETLSLAETFGDERRTEIVPYEIEQVDVEDLIQREDMVVLVSTRGYVKRVGTGNYRAQGRGGKGSAASNLRDDDFLEHVFVASTHDVVMFITSAGKSYWVKVHELPEGSRTARGQHIKSLLGLGADEDITAVVVLDSFERERFVFMATRKGIVKRVPVSAFANARTRGIAAIRLDDDDFLIEAVLTEGTSDLLLVTRRGQGLRIAEADVRPMGRTARGVNGIRLRSGDELAGATTPGPSRVVLVVTQNGYGKRMSFDELAPHGRGTLGQVACPTSDRTGEVVGVEQVDDRDELVMITSQGLALKTRAEGVPVYGRSAQGVRVVNLDAPDVVVGFARIAVEDAE